MDFHWPPMGGLPLDRRRVVRGLRVRLELQRVRGGAAADGAGVVPLVLQGAREKSARGVSAAPELVVWIGRSTPDQSKG